MLIALLCLRVGAACANFLIVIHRTMQHLRKDILTTKCVMSLRSPTEDEMEAYPYTPTPIFKGDHEGHEGFGYFLLINFVNFVCFVVMLDVSCLVAALPR
jgi:hypothetical protein